MTNSAHPTMETLFANLDRWRHFACLLVRNEIVMRRVIARFMEEQAVN